MGSALATTFTKKEVKLMGRLLKALASDADYRVVARSDEYASLMRKFQKLQMKADSPPGERR